MRIFEYLAYGLAFMVFGAVFIGLAITGDDSSNASLTFMLIGIAGAAPGAVLTTIGVIAKGVQVGNR